MIPEHVLRTPSVILDLRQVVAISIGQRDTAIDIELHANLASHGIPMRLIGRGENIESMTVDADAQLEALIARWSAVRA